MLKRSALMVLILLLIPSTVLADFTMGSSSSTVDACSSETSLIIVTTTNTGANADTFSIGLSGDVAKWSVVAPQGFVLQAGQTQNSYIYTTVPSSTKSGIYDLQASISSTSGGQQTQSYTITVGECNSVQVSAVSSDNSNFCTCTSETFEFLIKNTGRWAENYEVSLSGSAAEYSTLSQSVVNLQSDEGRSVTANVNPTCGDTGSFELTLTAKSLDSDVVESRTVNLGVDGCYNFDFALAENYLSFCDNSEAKVPVTIENTGTVKNDYNINVDGPNWASFDKKKISANAGKSQTTNLILSPKFGEVGNFPMTISVEGVDGDKKMEDSFTANILSCRQVDVEVAQKTDVLCGGTTRSYSLSVVNAGEFDERYAISVTGQPWGKLNKNFVAVGSGGASEILLELSPEITVPTGSYTFTVEAKSQNIGDSFDQDSIDITVPPRESCFGVQLEAERTNLDIIHGEGVLVPIVINNVGTSSAQYELEISGSGASLAQLNPGIVEMDGGSAETVYLHLSAPDDAAAKSYRITVAARSVEDQTVTGSTAISFTLSEAPTPSTTITDVGTDEEPVVSTDNGALRLVSSFVVSAASKARSVANIGWSYAKSSLINYWHMALIGLGALLLLLVILKFGIFKREDDWFDDFEDLFDDDGEFTSNKPAKKISPKKEKGKEKSKEKGLVGKFMAWLTEEDDFDDFEFEYEEINKKSKSKSKPGTLSKFKAWLEEDDFKGIDSKKTKPAKKTKAKKAKTTKTKATKKDPGAWKKFMIWLYEEDELPSKKPSKTTKPTKKATVKKEKASKIKAKRSAWGKVVDWLYEEDEPAPKKKAPSKKVAKSAKKSAKKPAKKLTRKKTKGRKK